MQLRGQGFGVDVHGQPEVRRVAETKSGSLRTDRSRTGRIWNDDLCAPVAGRRASRDEGVPQRFRRDRRRPAAGRFSQRFRGGSAEPEHEVDPPFRPPVIHIETVELIVGGGPQLGVPLALDLDRDHQFAQGADDVDPLVVLARIAGALGAEPASLLARR